MGKYEAVYAIVSMLSAEEIQNWKALIGTPDGSELDFKGLLVRDHDLYEVISYVS